MAKAYMTSLPNTTDTQKGLVKVVDSPKVPAMDYRSGFRDVGTAIDNTNQFLDTFSKMKYEGFQADLDRLELEHLHQMQDAKDPCELEALNEEWKKKYDSALKDDVWSRSYYKSKFYKQWQDRNQQAQQKIYYAKQHEFAEICATETLNKMAETASLLDNPNDVEQYIQNGEAMLRNIKHLSADSQHKLMANFYKDTVSRLYNSDPNKAVAFLDSVGNRYDAYGVSSEEIRKKADTYNKTKAREARADQMRAIKLANEQETMYGQNVLAQYYRGNMSKSEAEDSLYTRGMQTGNLKAYNSFMKATKPVGSKTIDKKMLSDYISGAQGISSEKDLDKYNLDFFTQHAVDLDSGTRTAINDYNTKLSSFVKGENNYYPWGENTVEELADMESLGEGMSDVAVDTYARINNLTSTQKTNLSSAVKNVIEVGTKQSTNIKNNYNTQIEDIKTDESPDRQVYKFNSLENKINKDKSLLPSDRESLLQSIIKDRKTASDAISQKKNTEYQFDQYEALKDDIQNMDLDLSAINDNEALDELSFMEKQISESEKGNYLTKEQANALRNQVQNKRSFLLNTRLMDNLNLMNIESATLYNPNDPDSALEKIKAHNTKVYTNRYNEMLEKYAKMVNFGDKSYEDAENQVMFEAEANSVARDKAQADFSKLAKDRDFTSQSESILKQWEDFYGYYDDKNADAVYAHNKSKGVFRDELYESWNKNRSFKGITVDSIRESAELARGADRQYTDNTERLRTKADVLLNGTIKKDSKTQDFTYNGQTPLSDFQTIVLAKNSNAISDENYGKAYFALYQPVKESFAPMLSAYKEMERGDLLYPTYDSNNASNVIIQLAKLEALNSTGDMNLDYDTIPYIRYYEEVIPYLYANGWTINSQIGTNKVAQLAAAVFWDKFDSTTTYNFYGTLITPDMIKAGKESSKDIVRPMEATYGSRK